MRNPRRLRHPPDGDPDQPYPVPGEEQFDPGIKFIESAELNAIGGALCSATSDGELQRTTRGLTVRYLWKAEGGRHHGANILGKCVKPSGLVRHFSGADFVIWLAADHLRAHNGGAPATRFQIEACLYHELKHIGVEEDEETGDEKPVLRPHDLEEFNAVILRYGAWDEAVELAAAAFTQMPLWPTAPAGAVAAVEKFASAMQEMVDDERSGVTAVSVSAGGETATIARKKDRRGEASARGAD